jgi:hypothetical protein
VDVGTKPNATKRRQLQGGSVGNDLKTNEPHHALIEARDLWDVQQLNGLLHAGRMAQSFRDTLLIRGMAARK